MFSSQLSFSCLLLYFQSCFLRPLWFIVFLIRNLHVQFPFFPSLPYFFPINFMHFFFFILSSPPFFFLFYKWSLDDLYCFLLSNLLFRVSFYFSFPFISFKTLLFFFFFYVLLSTRSGIDVVYQPWSNFVCFHWAERHGESDSHSLTIIRFTFHRYLRFVQYAILYYCCFSTDERHGEGGWHSLLIWFPSRRSLPTRYDVREKSSQNDTIPVDVMASLNITSRISYTFFFSFFLLLSLPVHFLISPLPFFIFFSYSLLTKFPQVCFLYFISYFLPFHFL